LLKINLNIKDIVR